jgi:homocysteine S-methyltransferase
MLPWPDPPPGRPALVLDGALATELEARGADLHDPLWSARTLLEQPALVEDVHLAYLEAGADVLTTATYQATFEGFAARGVGPARAEALLRQAVELPRRAWTAFRGRADAPDRRAPLVAASIGPYGAFLHDGSEYRGDYDRTDRELAAFHRDRLRVLAGAGPDLLALETIPSRRDAEVLADLLEREGTGPAWLSFSGRDEAHIADGTPFRDCVRALAGATRIAAVGINCTPPFVAAALLESAAAERTVPFVVYPNSGETYHAPTGSWHGTPAGDWLEPCLARWLAAGARGVGGCCRTTPGTVRRIRRLLAGDQAPEEP